MQELDSHNWAILHAKGTLNSFFKVFQMPMGKSKQLLFFCKPIAFLTFSLLSWLLKRPTVRGTWELWSLKMACYSFIGVCLRLSILFGISLWILVMLIIVMEMEKAVQEPQLLLLLSQRYQVKSCSIGNKTSMRINSTGRFRMLNWSYLFELFVVSQCSPVYWFCSTLMTNDKGPILRVK